MKVLVTGAGGFVGAHLLEALYRHGHQPVALGIGGEEKLKAQGVPALSVNILDIDELERILQEEKPDAVIHLAAISNVVLSWDIPDTTAETNICGTIRLVMAMAKIVPDAKLITVGSSDEYGLTAKAGAPLTEEMPCCPQTPYAISKYSAEQMALQLGRKFDMNVICTRSFNHFGPGQAKGFVVSDFASQIAAIERGLQEPILQVGDLSSSRDFTYVADIVEAYTLLMEMDVAPGVYNVCSERARTIREMLDTLLSISGYTIRVVNDGKKRRPSEVPFFIGCSSKLRKATGWTPKMNIKTGLNRTLSYWKECTFDTTTNDKMQ